MAPPAGCPGVSSTQTATAFIEIGSETGSEIGGASEIRSMSPAAIRDEKARVRRRRVRRAGPKRKPEVEMAQRGRTTIPAQLCVPYLLWLYLLLATVPAQLGCLVVVAEPEVVLYPHDAPRGLLINGSLRIIGVLAASA